MPDEPGSLKVPVRPDVDKSFGQRLEKDLDGPLGRIRGRIGQVGKMVAAGLGVGLAAAAVGLYKIGESFDDAYDTIRVGTGATGDALETLKADFRDVVASVPTDFKSASTAISDLNTRLGLTGEPLRTVSKQVLELSRLTGTDVKTNVETVSRVFGDWGVATDDQSAALDKLFRASQATGPSVDAISQSLVKYGAPLRQLGFSFEESASLIGKFEKEGVNTGLVLGSMRVALGKMAKAGEPAAETFRRVTDDIKNAGSASEANAIALELFGSRAGPDMAAAIREGRFELGSLLDTVANGSETILSAGRDTEDFAEKWTRFKNRVLLALEPVANSVFGALGSAMDVVGPKIETLIGGVTAFFAAFRAGNGDVTSSGFAGKMEEIANRVREVWDRMVEVVRTVGPILRDIVVGAVSRAVEIFKSMVGLVSRNVELFKVLGVVVAGATTAFVALLVVRKIVGLFQLVTAAVLKFNAALLANPIGLIVVAIGAVVALLFLAYRRFEGFRNVVDTVARVVRDVFVKAVSWLVENVLPSFLLSLRIVWNVLKGVASWLVTAGVAAWNTIRNVIAAVAGWISTNLGPIFSELGALVSTVFGWISNYISFAVGFWSTVISAAMAVIRPVLSWVWTVLQPQIAAALSIIAGVWSAVWNTVKGVAVAVWNTIRGVIEGALRIIRGVIQFVTGVITGDWRKAWDGIKNIVGGAVGVVKSLVSGAFNTLRSIVSGALHGVWSVVRGIWDGIVGTVAGVGGRLSGAAAGMWDGIKNAFRSALNWVIDRWNGLEFRVPSVEAFGMTIGGFTLGVPDLPRLAMGGLATSPGLSIVGDGGNGSGAELLALPRGAGVVPLDVAAMIAGAALAGREARNGQFRDLVVVEPAASADEIADTVDRRLSWRQSLPGAAETP